MSDRALPVISVHDLPATRSFYEELGFSQTYQFPPDGEPGFVTMETRHLEHRHRGGGATDEDRFGTGSTSMTWTRRWNSSEPRALSSPSRRTSRGANGWRAHGIPEGNLVYLGAAL